MQRERVNKQNKKQMKVIIGSVPSVRPDGKTTDGKTMDSKTTDGKTTDGGAVTKGKSKASLATNRMKQKVKHRKSKTIFEFSWHAPPFILCDYLLRGLLRIYAFSNVELRKA